MYTIPKKLLKIKVSFEIENANEETIRALNKYLYETLHFGELLNKYQQCSNLKIIQINPKQN